MRKENLKKTALITMFLFIFTLFNNINVNKVKAGDTEEELINVDTICTLVGNLMNANGLGEDWSPSNVNGKLKEYKNGIYESTYTLKAGNYEYKVAVDESSEKEYGKNGENVSLSLDKDTEVTFRFDLNKKEVYDSINNPSCFKSKAILVGGISDCLGGQTWVPGDDNFKLDYIGGGMYLKNFKVVKPGTMEYKVAYNGAWDNGEIASNTSVEIPEKTENITIFSDYFGNVATDSINTPSLNKTISLIGTVRSGNGDWDVSKTDYDMYRIDKDTFMYTCKLTPNSYEYKGVINHNWDEGSYPAVGNKSLNLTEEKNVVFIVDTVSGEIIDSVNDYIKVAESLGLREKEIPVVKGPVINDNGTITFKYKDAEAKSVYLSSNINDWSKNSNAFTKLDDENWSLTLRIGDKEQDVFYKFIVDGEEILDPDNEDVKDELSYLKFNEYKGRPVTIPGSLAAGIDGTSGTWNPADKALQLDYIGNGNYKKTFTVKAGNYDYKAAINYTWDPENYGLKGVIQGENIHLSLEEKQDVTFYYNDDSHIITSSIDYKALDIVLNNGSETLGKFNDEKLKGIYTIKVKLNKGTYNNLSLSIGGNEEKVVKIDTLVLNEDKTVTFSYDPKSETCFNDVGDTKIDLNGLYYDSRNEEYKNPYGAIKEGTAINFALKATKDMLKSGKLIVVAPDGTKILNLRKDGSFDDGSDKWTVEFTPSIIGTYSYYFVVSNGSDVKGYGDDDGNFGTGITSDLDSITDYEFNVCTSDFKTPEWLKNGIIYQIYPDRFFNGDVNNDYTQKYSRGDTPYEFIDDWYSLPKDPELYKKAGFDYPANANKGDMSAWANDLYGGDLKGIEKKITYLKALGVTILYLNPMGKSISSHRYDTTSYSEIDPQLGTMDDFVNLAKVAHEQGMHIILDGVYNHVSDDSIYFDKFGKYIAKGKPLGAYQYWSRVYDEMNNNGLSKENAEKKVVEYYNSIGITDLHYKDWFVINNERNTGNPAYYTYEGWSGFDSMPVIQALGGSEYNVKSWADEIIDSDDSIARKWLRLGSNGWRLDVANEVSSETWRAFRKVTKSEGDNALIGEIWTDASMYLLGDMYDSVMNYRFRGSMLNFVKGTQEDNKTVKTARDSMDELEKMREQYPREALEAMMNLVSTHDTQRVLSALDGYAKGKRDFAKDATELAKAKVKLIPFMQMTYIGAPTIYYGDEVGMVGCDDPDNRRGFIWGKGDKELVEWYARLAAIRNSYSALRTGDLIPIDVEDKYADDVMAYVRSDEDSKILVAANRQENDITVTVSAKGIADGTKLTNVLSGDENETYIVKDGKVTVNIKALNGVILADKFVKVKIDTENLKSAYSSDSIVDNREVPLTDEKVIEKVNNAKDGDEVVISYMDNEGISLNLLESISNSGKDIKPIIERNNYRIVIRDIKKLAELVRSQGLTDLLVNIDNFCYADNKYGINKENVKKSFDIKTNLKDKKLDVPVTIMNIIGEVPDGETLYGYYEDINGNLILGGSGVVNNSIFTFDADSVGVIYVLDKNLESQNSGQDVNINPGNNPNNSNIEGDNNQNDNTNIINGDENLNSQENNENSVIGQSSRTGDSSVGSIIVIVAMMVLTGIVIVVYSRRRKESSK